MHDVGCGFAVFSAGFATDYFGGRDVRADIVPARKRGVAAERRRFAGEVGENFLGDIFGEMRIAANATNGDGINETEVTLDEFGERVFRAILNIAAE